MRLVGLHYESLERVSSVVSDRGGDHCAEAES